MFKDVGIDHIKSFINSKTKDILNEEIDEISNNYLINGVTRASTWINNNLCEINYPIVNINKVNLLEIASDVHRELIKSTSNNYILSNVRIMIEKKNSHPVPWHTDQTPGVIRAIIYLKGGDKNNGHLSYIEGSHNSSHEKNLHKINPYEVGLEEKIITFDTQEGDLIFFDINGFHKKKTVENERRILFFEFHDGKSNKPMSQIIFDNSKITKNLKNNLDFLLSDNDKNLKSPALYSNALPLQTPLRIFSYYFKIFIKLFITRIKNKIKKNLQKYSF